MTFPDLSGSGTRPSTFLIQKIRGKADLRVWTAEEKKGVNKLYIEGEKPNLKGEYIGKFQRENIGKFQGKH